MTDVTPLKVFISEMTRAVAGRPTEQELVPQAETLMRNLMDKEDWLPAPYAQPNPEKYCQYLLHCDPLERFSIVSFVWEPGQKTPIHDHRTWGVIGVFQGQETETSFTCEDGAIVAGETHEMPRGSIGIVSPRIGDIHQVENKSNSTAISIHVYGGNVGAIKRRVYDPITGEASDFISGYTRDDVPNLWQP